MAAHEKSTVAILDMKKLIGKLLLFFLIFIVSSGICATNQNMKGNTGKKIVETLIRVESGLTAVLQQEMSIFIDYKNGVLYNQNGETGKCEQFLLMHDAIEIDLAEDLEQKALLDRSKLFAEIDVLDSYYEGSKTLLFGSTVNRMRRVASPVLRSYGVYFFPGRCDCKIRFFDGLDPQLLNIAREHEKYFSLNPLLRQIDVLGLIPYVGGVVVETNKRGVITKYSYELVKDGTIKKRLPKGCESLRQ